MLQPVLDWAVCSVVMQEMLLRARERGVTYFRRRLSWTTHSTPSQRQLPQGNCSTTSQRTLRALQDAHARGARRLVTLLPSFLRDVESLHGGVDSLCVISGVEPLRFLSCVSVAEDDFLACALVLATSDVLSAGPCPGVDTDSEREWNSDSLFAMVGGGGVLFCRPGHVMSASIRRNGGLYQRSEIRMYKGAQVVGSLGPPCYFFFFFFLSQRVDRTGWWWRQWWW